MARRRTRILLLSFMSLTTTALLLAQSPSKNSGARKPASHASPVPPSVTQGKKLFEDHCAICHFDASRATKIGPGLKGLAKRVAFTDGRKLDDASLRAWIEKGGKNMPGFKDSLSGEQVRALIAYVKTL